jgi:hypothetical protein
MAGLDPAISIALPFATVPFFLPKPALSAYIARHSGNH